MKICFVTTGDITSLATMKRATGMANSLITAGHQVGILMLDCENNKQRIDLECPKVDKLLFSNGNFLHEVRQKQRLIKEWYPNLVYVCSFGFRNCIHKYNTAKNTICVVEHSELLSAIPNQKKTLYRLLESLSLRVFDGQIFASKYLENHYTTGSRKKRLGNKPYLYSPYAYNKDMQEVDKTLYDELLQKYEGKEIILYMGTLIRNYGFLDIIKASELMKYPNAKVLILGKGGDKAHGEQYIKEHKLEDKVELLGYVSEEDLSAYFSLANIFVSPLYDTIQDKARCPSKLFMYLAYDKPVVTCKIGEAYQIFGDAGYYFNPGKVDEFAALLDSLSEKDSSSNIDYTQHEWGVRSADFLSWIDTNFKKRL